MRSVRKDKAIDAKYFRVNVNFKKPIIKTIKLEYIRTNGSNIILKSNNCTVPQSRGFGINAKTSKFNLDKISRILLDSKARVRQ